MTESVSRAAAAETAADVAVVGAGPAGLAAAVAAADHGASVIVIDEAPRAGGQIWRHRVRSALPATAREWVERFMSSPAVHLAGASVVDAQDEPLTLTAQQGAAVVHVRARAVILATGARELFLPFPGWTLPGVIGAGGVQALLKSGLDVRGKRILIGGSGPLLFPVAAALAGAGAHVLEVLEQTPTSRLLRFGAGLWRTPRRLLEAASYRRAFMGAAFRSGTWVTRADAGPGGAPLRVTVTDGSRSRTVECDLLCTGYGLVPSTELPRLLGCELDGDVVRVDARHATSVPGVYAAGEPTGVAGVDAALLEGTIAGIAAAGGTPARSLLRRRSAHARFAERITRAFVPRAELRGRVTADTLVCRCEDVTRAHLEGYGSVREAKLATRAGMGPCQGRICGPALRCLYGWDADAVRTPVLPANIQTMIATAAHAEE